MDEQFLRYYDQELRFIRDIAGEFARQHSGPARYLSIDEIPCADPYVERLLEGFAFLAARVRLRLDTSFDRFAGHLLEMVYPDYLAPTPSMAIVQFEPDFRSGSFEDGPKIPRDTVLRTRAGLSRSSRCTYVVKHDVTLWPIRISEAAYLQGSAVQAAGVPKRGPWSDGKEVRAALKLTLATVNDLPFRQVLLDRLVLHLPGEDRLAHRLYEAMLAHGVGISVAAPGAQPAERFYLGAEAIRRVGFTDEEALFPVRRRGFQGYRLLREYFAFPNRFMFVELAGLRQGIGGIKAGRAEIVIGLDRIDPDLQDSVTTSNFVLFAAPAINLFQRRGRVDVDAARARHRVVVDPQRETDYEVYDLVEVRGYAPQDSGTAIDFQPFYGMRTGGQVPAAAYYTLERRARLLSSERRRRERQPAPSYLGGDVFVNLVERRQRPFNEHLDRLEVEVLCTNRGLPLQIAPERDRSASHLAHATGAPIRAIRFLGDPTPPRPSLAYGPTRQPAQAVEDYRDVPWRLVSHLALNYLSLVDTEDGEEKRGAEALRDLLRLYADHAQPALARQPDGLRSVSAAPIVRRIPGGGPITFGRGLEVSLTFSERMFQGSSVFLLAAVLEQFFRRYASINSFTETVVTTFERGEIKRWPARPGMRHAI